MILMYETFESVRNTISRVSLQICTKVMALSKVYTTVILTHIIYILYN